MDFARYFALHDSLRDTGPLSGESGRDLKEAKSIGRMCLCKRTHTSQWSRRSNFARMRRVPQEAKSERAISSFMIENGIAIAVRGAEKPLASEEERCSRGYASRRS